MHDEETVDVMVIGGGLAGLTAALVARRTGCSTRLVDARTDLGGRARTTVRNGVMLNEGPHALYRSGAASRILADLGVTPAGGVPETDGMQMFGRGGLHDAPTGLSTLLRTRALSGRAKLATARLMARLPRIDAGELGVRSAADWIDDQVNDAGARSYLRAMARLSTYSADLDRLSADVLVDQLRAAVAAGVLYVDGGWQSIVDDLTGRALAAGVHVGAGVKVDRVEPDAGAFLIRRGAQVARARSVVFTAGGPRSLAAVVPDAAPIAARWHNGALASTVAVLDVALTDPWGERPPVVVGLDDALYLSVHAPTAALAPPGTTLVSTMRYHSSGEAPDPGRDRHALHALLEAVRPDWEAVAAEVRFSQRLVAMTDQPTAERGGLRGRPDGSVPGLPGLFVAGDWVGPEGILADAAVASGRQAGLLAAAVGDGAGLVA